MRKFDLSLRSSRSSYFATFRHRSEERFSRNAETDIVCRLLLEKKTAVIPRVASERADLYLAAMLRGEGPDRAGQQPEDSKHPHGRTPYGEDSVQQDTVAPQNRK